jgi:hypothetical protein
MKYLMRIKETTIRESLVEASTLERAKELASVFRTPSPVGTIEHEWNILSVIEQPLVAPVVEQT